MLNLTMRQREVLEFMREFFAENDQLPPGHVIAKRFRMRSANSVQCVAYALERKGAIERNAVGKFRFARAQSQEAGAA
ncbi:hypothetical protein ACFIQF_22750 [Comamonas sp. J-3]|uniref:LexA family protein n=1 Tax=Comamonas trifloxystrobinivorans TaxID=3350256 RepID=UPI00372C95B3